MVAVVAVNGGTTKDITLKHVENVGWETSPLPQKEKHFVTAGRGPMEEGKGWKQLLIEPTEILACPYGLYFPLIFFLLAPEENPKRICKEIANNMNE